MSEWHPIKTVPKKIGDVILIANEYDVCTVFWDKLGFWSANHGDCVEIDFTPTHWMEIPEPPVNI